MPSFALDFYQNERGEILTTTQQWIEPNQQFQHDVLIMIVLRYEVVTGVTHAHRKYTVEWELETVNPPERLFGLRSEWWECEVCGFADALVRE